ncbi:slr1601 family putative cell division protein [Lyngbya aestuarii]|uniref:slr1601 family putative cell division protein n=1 Tax=Lyngbya aestuarii TaxID=118322 RepID=UPI00403DA554
MTSIQPSRPTRQTLKPRRKVPKTQNLPQANSSGAVAGETMLKLVANLVLCAGAFYGLSQLLPYQLSQQGKLREVKREVKRTERRVNNLRSDFSRSFDPRQAKSVMQEQSYRVDPNQRQVVWQESDSTADN